MTKSCCETSEEKLTELPIILLIGNPNVGKTLLFNYLTGSFQKVSNFPGTTVRGKEGKITVDGVEYRLVDLPGTYGLGSPRPEEKLTLQHLLKKEVVAIINVVDSSRLARNLFLTLQLTTSGIPMGVVLNQIDIAERRGTSIPPKLIEDFLHVPEIQLNALDEEMLAGLPSFISTVLKSHPPDGDILLGSVPELKTLSSISLLSSTFRTPSLRNLVFLVGDETAEQYFSSEELTELRRILLPDQSLKLTVISQIYESVDLYLSQFASLHPPFQLGNEQKIDNFLLDSKFGIPLFTLVMVIGFWLTFALSSPLSSILEHLALNSATWIRTLPLHPLLVSFFADAIIGGVGFVLVFIPQIFFLFLFLGILEHSGYMSRVIFIFDRFLGKAGISGKSLAPLLLGFGCNVPAVLATSSIEDENERIAVALSNPFLPCSARFPVFVIISGAVFREYAGLVVAAMYFIGVTVATLSLFVLRRTVLKGTSRELVLELPSLHRPPPKLLLSQTWLQLKDFIRGAATWMAGGLVFMWLLTITGPSGYLGPDAFTDSSVITKSWIFSIGVFLSPVFSPFGWDARLITALIFGFVAKEIVVGSLGLLFNTGGDMGLLRQVIVLQLPPVQALAFMVLVLTYIPCIGTYFALKKEIGTRWTNFSVVFGLVVAWSLAFLITVGGAFL